MRPAGGRGTEKARNSQRIWKGRRGGGGGRRPGEKSKTRRFDVSGNWGHRVLAKLIWTARGALMDGPVGRQTDHAVDWQQSFADDALSAAPLAGYLLSASRRPVIPADPNSAQTAAPPSILGSSIAALPRALSGKSLLVCRSLPLEHGKPPFSVPARLSRPSCRHASSTTHPPLLRGCPGCRRLPRALHHAERSS